MPNKIPDVLIDKIKQNEIIPFVGAGISTGVKDNKGNPLFLNWNELLLSSVNILNNNNMEAKANFIQSAIEVAESSECYLNIADNIKKYLSSQWKDFLNDNFNKNFNDINNATLNIPKEIWNLGNLVITTNYDNVMNWSSTDKNLVTWDKKAISGQVQSLKSLPENNTLWHLHGRIDNLDDIVLTKESYEAVYKEDSGSIEVLKYHMLTKSFVFLGFSLDDIYLREQLKKIQSLFAENANPHFIILKKGSETDLSEFGDIRPIYITDYEDNYLKVLKELSSYKNVEIEEVNNTKNTNENKTIDEVIKPFNVPFKSKEKGAIGIEDKLIEVHDTLSSTQKTKIGQKTSFQGMGGLGKTQLAVEYAHKYKDLYAGVIWLTIDQNLDEQFLDLATEQFGINPHIEAKEKIEMAKEKLFSFKNALIILDNVDTKDEIKEYYEKLSENKILVTSRNAIQGFSSIPLDTLTEENSLKLLASESCREIKKDELEYAKKICEELDGLPLALEMAGSYVEYSGISWTEYYELYKEDGVSFLELSDIDSCTKHEINISKTLSLSESILDKNPLLSQIIYLLAWSANEPMDKKLISIMLDEKELSLSIPISLGVKLKFIKSSDDGYTLHRLVRDIWRIKEIITKEFTLVVSQNLAYYMKEIKDDFLQLKELDRASLQAKYWANYVDDKYLKASLINYSVYPDYHKGTYEIALKNINEVYSLFKDDEDSEIYAEILNNKGFLINSLGDIKESKPYLEKALVIRERLYKVTENTDIFMSLHNLGWISNAEGDSQTAKIYLDKALHIAEYKYKNSAHSNMTLILNSVGNNLESLKDYNTAKMYYEQALNINKESYQGDSPSLAMSYDNLGGVLRNIGDCTNSKLNHMKALNMRERLYKDNNHPYIAISLNNMGVVLHLEGDLINSKIYHEKALNMRRKLFKDINHPDIADSLNNIGANLYAQGDVANSKIYHEKAYKMYEKNFGKNHATTVLYMLNYISCVPNHILTNASTIKILKKFKKELKDNKVLLVQVNDELKIRQPQIGREKSKRKKRR